MYWPELAEDGGRNRGARGGIGAAWGRVEEGRLGETEEGRQALYPACWLDEFNAVINGIDVVFNGQ